MQPDCDLCEAKGGVYDFERLCCRVRFTLAEFRRPVRRSWMNYWKKTLSPSEYRATEDEVKRLWQERTSQSRASGP